MRLGVVLLLGVAFAGCAQSGVGADGTTESATAPTTGPQPCAAHAFPERRMAVLCTTKFQYDEYAGAFMAFGPGPEEDFQGENRTHRFAPDRPLRWQDLELEWTGGPLRVWAEGPPPQPQPSPAALGRLHNGTVESGDFVQLCHPGGELRDPGLVLVDRSPLGGRVPLAFPFVLACPQPGSPPAAA
jgi:hypothetical protein